MYKKYIVVVFLLLFSITAIGQATPSGFKRVTSTSATFVQNQNAGNFIVDMSTNTIYQLIDGCLGTASISSLTIDVDYRVIISDIAYDETTWNGNLDAPTKNSVRDEIESIYSTVSDLSLESTLTFTVGNGSKQLASSDATIGFPDVNPYYALIGPVGGANAAPTFRALVVADIPVLGYGNVFKTGTPLNNQLAVWTTSTIVEGESSLVYTDDYNFDIIGDVHIDSAFFAAGGTGDFHLDGDVKINGTGNDRTDYQQYFGSLGNPILKTLEAYAQADVDGNGLINLTDLGLFNVYHYYNGVPGAIYDYDDAGLIAKQDTTIAWLGGKYGWYHDQTANPGPNWYYMIREPVAIAWFDDYTLPNYPTHLMDVDGWLHADTISADVFYGGGRWDFRYSSTTDIIHNEDGDVYNRNDVYITNDVLVGDSIKGMKYQVQHTGTNTSTIFMIDASFGDITALYPASGYCVLCGSPTQSDYATTVSLSNYTTYTLVVTVGTPPSSDYTYISYMNDTLQDLKVQYGLSLGASTNYAPVTGTLQYSSGLKLWDGSAWKDVVTNSMTTAGDILYGGASGVQTRLAGSGTNDWVLKYNTGTNAPYWGAGGGTSLWSEATNRLSPATAGNDIALAQASEEILLDDDFDTGVRCDVDDKIIWKCGNVDRMILAGSQLYPNSSGGVTLGTSGLPFGTSWFKYNSNSPCMTLVTNNAFTDISNFGSPLALYNSNATNGIYMGIIMTHSSSYGDRFAGIYGQVNDQTNDYGDLVFMTSGSGGKTEKVRIDEDGYMGVGQTAPASYMHLGNTSYDKAYGLKFNDGSFGIFGSADNVMDFYETDDIIEMRISTKGVSVNGTTQNSWFDINKNVGGKNYASLITASYDQDATAASDDYVFYYCDPESAINFTLATTTGTSGRYCYIYNFSSSNAVTIRVQTGDYLNKTLNGTYSLSTNSHCMVQQTGINQVEWVVWP